MEELGLFLEQRVIVDLTLEKFLVKTNSRLSSLLSKSKTITLRPNSKGKKPDNTYKNSNLSATTSPVKRGEPRNELKFLPRVRVWDAFSVKHPLMNHIYLLVRRRQKLDEGHDGTTRVAIAFCRLR